MSPQELEALIRQILAEGVPLNWDVYLLSFLLMLLAAGIGAYIGAYLKEKGKNWATKEDLDSLVAKEEQTAKAVQEVKGRISTETWVKQRRWD